MSSQKLGDCLAVFDMTLDTKRKRLDPLQQQKGTQGRQYRSGSPLVDAPAAPEIGGFLEMIGVDQIVIGGIRLGEHGEAIGVFFPGETAAIDDGSAESRSVATHELRER